MSKKQVGVQVDTRQYERIYERKPRGRGCWAFEIAGMRHWFDFDRAVPYSEAVRDAKREALKQGVTSITLLP